MTECIFCKIAKGEIPSKKAYEDEWIYAFHDLEPQAPVHVLIVPKKHLDSLDDTTPSDAALLGQVEQYVLLQPGERIPAGGQHRSGRNAVRKASAFPSIGQTPDALASGLI